MAARAHGWSPPEGDKNMPPVSVAKEFNEADTGSGILSRAMSEKEKTHGKTKGRNKKRAA